MKLNPVVVSSEPRYPARAVRLKGMYTWLRRAVATAAAAGALGLAGCYGSTPLGGEPGEPSEAGTIASPPPGPFVPVEERIMGDMAPMFFVCAESIPDSFYDLVGVPGWFEGSLCGEQTAFAAFDVSGAGADLRIGLDHGAEHAVLTVVGPDGVALAELGPDEPSVQLARAAGRWYLAATPIGTAGSGYEWFSGSVSLAE